MMPTDDIERSTDEVIADLRRKIDDITDAARSQDHRIKDRLNETRDEALWILCSAIAAIERHARDQQNEDELVKGLILAKLRSDELYEDTLRKIREIKDPQTAEDSNGKERKLTENSNSNDGPKETVIVKKAVRKAKTGTDDMTEKALDTLKDWLLPEGEEQ